MQIRSMLSASHKHVKAWTPKKRQTRRCQKHYGGGADCRAAHRCRVARSSPQRARAIMVARCRRAIESGAEAHALQTLARGADIAWNGGISKQGQFLALRGYEWSASVRIRPRPSASFLWGGRSQSASARKPGKGIFWRLCIRLWLSDKNLRRFACMCYASTSFDFS